MHYFSGLSQLLRPTLSSLHASLALCCWGQGECCALHSSLGLRRCRVQTIRVGSPPMRFEAFTPVRDSAMLEIYAKDAPTEKGDLMARNFTSSLSTQASTASKPATHCQPSRVMATYHCAFRVAKPLGGVSLQPRLPIYARALERVPRSMAELLRQRTQDPMLCFLCFLFVTSSFRLSLLRAQDPLLRLGLAEEYNTKMA